MRSTKLNGKIAARSKLSEENERDNERKKKRDARKGHYPNGQNKQVKQDNQNKQVVSIDSISTSYSSYTDTDTVTDTVTVTDTDTVTDTVTVTDTEHDTEVPSTVLMSCIPSSIEKNRTHKDFNAIDITLRAIAEEDSDYLYSEELSERFYKVNEERGWLDGTGEPIVDILGWYRNFCNLEFNNGYSVADTILA